MTSPLPRGTGAVSCLVLPCPYFTFLQIVVSIVDVCHDLSLIQDGEARKQTPEHD